MARILLVDPLLASEGLGIGPGWAGPEHEVVILPGYGIDDIRSALPGAEAILTAHAPVTEEMMALAPRLRLVAKPGAGVDNIDVAGAARRGVTVTNVTGARGRAVAEHALFLLLHLARKAWLRGEPGVARRAGHTARREDTRDRGHGRHRHASRPLRRRTRGCGSSRPPGRRIPTDLPDVPARFVDIRTALREADALALCAPLTDATRGLVRSRCPECDEGRGVPESTSRVGPWS